MTEFALSIRGANVAYGQRPALVDVSLDIPHGQRVALVGPSGAGKSTLLGLCNGAVHPGTGQVRVLGELLTNLSPRRLAGVRRQVGAVHQQLQLVGQLRVIHNVNAGRLGDWPWWRALLSLLHPQDVTRAQEALAALGIGDKLHSRTDELSGGEQQRVAVARVLVQSPAVVIADEPVSSLDPARAANVMALLCGPLGGDSHTLLASLHSFELAVAMCDRVIGLRDGRIVFDLPSYGIQTRHHRLLYSLK